jgi:hypothetical protein
MTQAEEHLPSKYQALSSKTSVPQKKNPFIQLALPLLFRAYLPTGWT